MGFDKLCSDDSGLLADLLSIGRHLSSQSSNLPPVEDLEFRLTTLLNLLNSILTLIHQVDSTWFANHGLDQIIQIPANVPHQDGQDDFSAVDPIHKEMNVLMDHICNVFGIDFFKNVVHGVFTKWLQSESSDHHKQRLLPLYLKAVITNLIPCDDGDFVKNKLTDLICNISHEKESWNQNHQIMFQNAMAMACKSHKSLLNVAISVLSECSRDPSHLIRCTCAITWNGLASVMESDQLVNVLIPNLNSLCSDVDTKVRCAALQPLITVTLNLEEVDHLKLVISLFEYYLPTSNITTLSKSPDDEYEEYKEDVKSPISKSHPDAYLQVLKIWSKILPKMEAYIRDKYALCKLVDVCRDNLANPNVQDRRAVALALFDCYRALNGCTLKLDGLRDYIVPGLELLETDVDQVLTDNASVRNSVRNMLRDLRAAIKAASSSPSGVGGGKLKTPIGAPSVEESLGSAVASNQQAKVEDQLNAAKQNISRFFKFGKQ
ncbi:hypothetical protein AKO1_014250 [Acrasis kona]|uniref:Uncharacterized protein n=1 Tax=Acrasis kona TaxID=1008807 RepID=A0AAW2ZBP2_9EUKA